VHGGRCALRGRLLGVIRVLLGDVQAGDDVHGQALGSFFGGTPGNPDIEKSPVTVTLTVTVPGTVAEVGTSNSTEYALLTNGSL
jgi:hypothetical protein